MCDDRESIWTTIGEWIGGIAMIPVVLITQGCGCFAQIGAAAIGIIVTISVCSWVFQFLGC